MKTLEEKIKDVIDKHHKRIEQINTMLLTALPQDVELFRSIKLVHKESIDLLKHSIGI